MMTASRDESSTFGHQEYTVEEEGALQRTLRQRLGPPFISQRTGAAGLKLAYIEGWRLINLANEIFGFNGWSHSVTQQTVDFVDFLNGKFYVGVSAIVKVQIKNGAFHEDVGYGSSEGMRSKGQALEKAKKESVTDGLKRALKSFGNSMGNCLGDKDFLKCISRAPKGASVMYNTSDMRHQEEDEAVTRARLARKRPAAASTFSSTSSSASSGSAMNAAYNTRISDGTYPEPMPAPAAPPIKRETVATSNESNSSSGNSSFTRRNSEPILAAETKVDNSELARKERLLKVELKKKAFQATLDKAEPTARSKSPNITDPKDMLIEKDDYEEIDIWSQAVYAEDLSALDSLAMNTATPANKCVDKTVPAASNPDSSKRSDGTEERDTKRPKR